MRKEYLLIHCFKFTMTKVPFFSFFLFLFYTCYCSSAMTINKEALVYSPDKIAYYLYTRANPNQAVQLLIGDPNSCLTSPYDPKLETKFIVHGWGGDYTQDFPQGFKNSYLETGDYNIILLDYGNFSSSYFLLLACRKSMGKAIAELLNELALYGILDFNRLHVIGHSFGAHLSATIAKYVAGTISRITALDPAGPGFDFVLPADRITCDDAAFVDVIHTSSIFGLQKLSGCVDFYPHGGDNQPSCQDNKLLMKDSCDHSMSWKYFLHTIYNQTYYTIERCPSVLDVKLSRKNCEHMTNAYMGEGSTRQHGIYYVSILP